MFGMTPGQTLVVLGILALIIFGGRAGGGKNNGGKQ